LSGPGTTTLLPGVDARLTGSLTLRDRTLNNGGALTYQSTLNWDGGATVNNLATGTFDLNVTGWFSSFALTGGPTFNNAGLVRKAANTDYFLAPLGGALAFNNSGVVEVNGGRLFLGGGGASSGSYVVAAGASLEFGATRGVSAGHSFAPGSSIRGAGTVQFTGPQAVVAGDYSVASTQVIVAVSSDDRVGGNVTFDADASTGSLVMDRGTLGGTGTLTVTGSLTWGSGRMTGSGTTRLAPGATAALGNDSALPEGKVLEGRTFDNAGSVTWQGTATGDGLLTLRGGAAWVNEAMALFDIQNDLPLDAGPGGGMVVNAGTFRKSAGTNATVLSSGVSFFNSGAVQVQTGSLRLAGPGVNRGTITVAGSGTLDIRGDYTFEAGSSVTGAGVTFTSGSIRVDGQVTASDGLLIGPGAAVSGVGTIRGPVLNTGRLTPGDGGAPGTLTITGDYRQTATATLGVVLGGPDPTGPFSKLVVTGAADLAGVLEVTLADGFTPQAGNQFSVLSYGSRHGTFDSIRAPDLSGLRFDTRYDALGFALLVVPA
jgi:hypothetical protein